MIREGRVSIASRIVREPEHPTLETEADIRVDGQHFARPVSRYLMLNKPRGLVTTTHDERSRDTVYRCFDDSDMGWIAPVGRLDKASEGLLLFSNDPQWAARVTDPATGPSKTYHVQVCGIPDDAALHRMRQGVQDQGERLTAVSARMLRVGESNAWLEIVLGEGRNRQIRRILQALDFEVLRLVRVSIGRVALGELAKGAWRELSADEVAALVGD